MNITVSSRRLLAISATTPTAAAMTARTSARLAFGMATVMASAVAAGMKAVTAARSASPIRRSSTSGCTGPAFPAGHSLGAFIVRSGCCPAASFPRARRSRTA